MRVSGGNGRGCADLNPELIAENRPAPLPAADPAGKGAPRLSIHPLIAQPAGTRPPAGKRKPALAPPFSELRLCGYAGLSSCPQRPPIRCDCFGAGAAGLMCAAVAGQRGRRVALLTTTPARAQNPHLRRRAVQFQQISTADRGISFENKHLPSRRWPSTSPALYRTGRALRNPLAREDPGPAILRQVRARNSRDAAGRVRLGGVEVVLNAGGIAASSSGGFSVESLVEEFSG